MSKVTLNPKNITVEKVVINVIDKNDKLSQNTKNILKAAFTTTELSEELWDGVKSARNCGNFEAVKQAALKFIDQLEKAFQINDLTYFFIKHAGELIHRDDYFEMARHQIEENSFRIEYKDPELMGKFVMNREELKKKREQERAQQKSGDGKKEFGEVKNAMNR